ncbi:hypothetical protein FB107DRAFT_205698, partial [Schizophyllum commune]
PSPAFVHDPAVTTILYLHPLSFICLSLSPSRIYASHIITQYWGQPLLIIPHSLVFN